MNTYFVRYEARERGALGVTSTYNVRIEARNEEEAWNETAYHAEGCRLEHVLIKSVELIRS